VKPLEQWRHVFKLDPDRPISDAHLERICESGTDAVIVGGSDGVTFANTSELLMRIRRFDVPCALEVSAQDAIVPGFDRYFIPVVLNAGNPDWLIGHHHAAVRRLGPVLPWDMLTAEAYVILNPASTAARVTEANTRLDPDDVAAYAQIAERLFGLPIVYLEYSGMYGDMALVERIKTELRTARLFYGGGIDSRDKARRAAQSAHTIVVGNVIYEDIERALSTVDID